MGFMDTVSSVASSMLKGVTGGSQKSGTIAKAVITAYADPIFKTFLKGDEAASTIVLPLISSDGISQKFCIEWAETDSTAQGESFKVISGFNYKWGLDTLDLDVVVDATGVFVPTSEDDKGNTLKLINYASPNIEPYIKKLKELVYAYNKESHLPPYLKLTWGKIFTASSTDANAINGVYKCVLSEMEIKYELFAADGTPVRAIVSLKLKPYLDANERPFGNSPDLSHIIEIKYGDNLPKLCQDIYDSPEYYHQVAKVNGLQSAYDLEPGMRLLFPPLDKFDR